MTGGDTERLTTEVAMLKNNRDVVGRGRVTGGYIHDLEVIPEYRRRGIATWIVTNLVTLGGAFLWVAKDNEPAIALYRKLGFRVDTEEEGYYRMRRSDADCQMK